MAEQSQASTPPPSDTSSRQWQHRRATSAFAKLDSPQTRKNSNPLANTPAAMNSRIVTQANVPPFEQHHVSQFSSAEALEHPKSASFAPTRQFRGKDWESWKQTQTDRLDDDMRLSWLRKPLRKTGDAHSHDVAQQKPVSHLEMSSVQRVFVYSPRPRRPTQILSLVSPISLGPQSSELSQPSIAISPHPPSPDCSELPKYMSAFEYAIRPFLEDHIDREYQLHLPPATQQDAASEVASPLLPPLRGDEISYVGSGEEKADIDIPEDGIPAHLKEKNAFRTRMRHIQLRILLMRCTVLLSTVRDLERKPWAQETTRPPYWYYSKMRQLAYRARRLAEALESRDLQARCEYWAGRACGGTRDYYTAAEHFEMAVKLDVHNDTYPGGRLRLRGLRPNEKGDVRFLWDSVSTRHENWERKTANARIVARYESDRTGKPLKDCIDQDGWESPPWAPDRDRVVHLARREFGIRRRLGKRAKFLDTKKRELLGQEMDAKVKKQWDEEGIDESEMTRRVLDEKEWRYIRHGDEKTAERRARQESATQMPNPRTTPGRPTSNGTSGILSSSPSLPQSSHRLSKEAWPITHLTLKQELKQAGWASRSPTPPLLARATSPPIGLLQRRNTNIEPIRTGNIQK